MVKKFRIFLLLGINTLVLYGLVLGLMPRVETQQYIVIAIAMVLVMIAPNLIINRALNTLERALTRSEGELEATREELQKLKEKLAEVTTQDELTGTFNKSYLLNVLTQHRGMAERGSYYFCVAVVQVDQFTDVVDKHGLTSGNEVLQLYARIVKAALREVDVVARIGTDTFALLLSGATEDDSVMIINRIAKLINQIQIADDEDLKITNSGGITSFHGTETSGQLIDNATQALEFAVEQGRDRVAGFLYQPPEEVLNESVAATAEEQPQQ